MLGGERLIALLRKNEGFIKPLEGEKIGSKWASKLTSTNYGRLVLVGLRSRMWRTKVDASNNFSCEQMNIRKNLNEIEINTKLTSNVGGSTGSVLRH